MRLLKPSTVQAMMQNLRLIQHSFEIHSLLLGGKVLFVKFLFQCVL